VKRRSGTFQLRPSLILSRYTNITWRQSNLCRACKGKDKGTIPLLERRQGAHLPFYGRWVRRWMDHWVWDAWPVRRQTYGYLSSRRASPPFGRYQVILLGDRGTCVWTTCLKLFPCSALARSRTCNLGFTSSERYRYTTKQRACAQRKYTTKTVVEWHRLVHFCYRPHPHISVRLGYILFYNYSVNARCFYRL